MAIARVIAIFTVPVDATPLTRRPWANANGFANLEAPSCIELLSRPCVEYWIDTHNLDPYAGNKGGIEGQVFAVLALWKAFDVSGIDSDSQWVVAEVETLRKNLVFLPLMLVCFCGYSAAQLWSGILDPSRAIDWSNAGVNGGIPNRSTVCATLSPGASAAQINTAISNCAAGQVVQLNAGTYNLSGVVNMFKSNVTLRGAGPDQTFLIFNPGGGCIIGGSSICMTDGQFGFYPPNPGGTANWTAGYAQGTTSITIDNVVGHYHTLAVGDMMMLDQCNSGLSGNAGQNADGTEKKGCGTGAETDSGNIWVCSGAGTCSSEGDSNVRRYGRNQNQAVVVTNISGSGPYTVTFTPGLYMPNWVSARSPGVWWGSTTSAHGIGIEDLSMDNSNNNAYSGIFVGNVYDWWVKNVRSIYAARAAVWSYGGARGTIRDSYFFGTINAESISYGIETDISGGILVENNIFQGVALPTPTGEAVAGNVYGYNYAVNDFYVSGGNVNWMQSGQYNHSGGVQMMLNEGNIGPGFTADAIHGTSDFTTLFRNRYFGLDTTSDNTHGTKTQQTDAVQPYAFNRYINSIGNVLGTDGFHTLYEYYPTSQNCGGNNGSCPGTIGVNTSIYMLGWSGNAQQCVNCQPGITLPDDLLVRNSMMRWGNYDAVNQANRFVASEVPSGLSPYGNAVPSNQNLPPSFYLNAQPSWWTANKPWPAIGPDVSNGNLGVCSGGTYANAHAACTANSQCSGGGICVGSTAGGHANSIPAEDCYLNVMNGPPDGTGGVLTYNANSCYGGGGGAPGPPSNLSANVQ